MSGKKRGRPTKAPEDRHDGDIKLRVTAAVEQLVEATARAHKTSVSEIVRWCIDGHLPTLYMNAVRARQDVWRMPVAVSPADKKEGA